MTLFSFLSWLGTAIVGVLLLLFLLGVGVAIVKQAKQFDEVRRRLGMPNAIREQANKLGSFPVTLIGIWYVLCLVIALFVAYNLLPAVPSVGVLAEVKASPQALYLVQTFLCGLVGAIVYGMLQVSKGEDEVRSQWLFRRFILLPILGGLLGAISYFFVGAGLLEIPVGETAEAMNNAMYAIAFLSGFASRELTAKLIQIAEIAFTKVGSPNAPPPAGKPSAAVEPQATVETPEEKELKKALSS